MSYRHRWLDLCDWADRHAVAIGATIIALAFLLGVVVIGEPGATL